MEILIVASLITSLLAGVAALFAPCCIGVLLPAYFASIFRQKKTVFLMTLVFFFGLLAIFLPLGLGFGLLGQILKQYHNLIYGIGAGFLFLLGMFILLGFHFSLPFQTKSQIKVTGMASVFVLGIFSAFATLCCAPVLAGALALSTLPGSIFWGGVYSLAYVFGMAAPLFLISLFIDKVNFEQKFQKTFSRPIRYRLLGKEVSIAVSEAVSGVTFLAMGVLILYFALTNKLFMQAGGYQTDINIFLTKILQSINGFIKIVPEYVWAIILIVLVVLIVKWSIKQFIRENKNNKNYE